MPVSPRRTAHPVGGLTERPSDLLRVCSWQRTCRVPAPEQVYFGPSNTAREDFDLYYARTRFFGHNQPAYKNNKGLGGAHGVLFASRCAAGHVRIDVLGCFTVQ